jgi:hypothetical protein
MAQGFYELLGVEPRASQEEVREAYQGRLADLVRRLRVARQQGADVSILESQEAALREAMEVIAEPARRRRYDALRQASLAGLPEDVETLWAQSRGALVDPVAGVSLAVVRALTDLPVGDPIPEPPGGWRRGRRRSSSPGAPPVATPPVTGAPPPPAPKSAAPAAGPGVTSPASVNPWKSAAPTLVPATDVVVAFDPPAQQPPTLTPPDAQLPPPPEREAERGASEAPAPLRGLTSAPLPSSSPPPHRSSLGADSAHQGRGSFGDIVIEPAAPPAPPPPPADPIDALRQQHGTDGAFLRGVRDLRGLDLDALSATTRISTRYLGAIEENGFDRLPAATFVRGYLKQITAVLELEEQGVVEGYMALYAQHRG